MLGKALMSFSAKPFWIAVAALVVPLWAEQSFIANGELKIRKVDSDGRLIDHRSFKIVEARDRSGNRYTSQDLPEGRLVTLWLKEKGELYSINFASRQIALLGISRTSPGLEGLAAAESAETPPPNKSVLDSTCVLLPVFSSVGGHRKQIGEVCISKELGGVRMYRRMEWTLGGDNFRDELDIVSIRRDAEPDPSWFQLPQGFSLMNRRASTPMR